MENSVRKFFVIAFAALVLVLVAGLLLIARPRWERAEAARQAYQQDTTTFAGIKAHDHVMLARSEVQIPSPVDAVKANLDTARERAKEVPEKIKRDDAEFESFFAKDGVEVRAGSQFRDLYQQRVEKKLLPLLNEKGVYNQPADNARPAIRVAAGLAREPDITEPRQKALQKQAWIYHRLIFSLLKLSSDGTPLVRELVLSSTDAEVAIEIKNCEELNEKDKADERKSAAEPLFYGTPSGIPQITVSFTVILDERHVGELLDELRVYNTARQFRPNFSAEERAEMDEIKPIFFQEQRVTITRLAPSEQYAVPALDQVVEGDTRAETKEKIEQMERPVRMKVELNVLDYNPYYKEH